MKVEIKSRGCGEKEGFPPIIKYLSEIKKGSQIIIKLDEDSLEGYDLVFDSLSVSNVKVESNDDNREHTITFTCTMAVFKNLLKLIRNLKLLGDCGHSFGVRINGKMFSWDGDGSDRVIGINGVDCGNGFKEFDSHYKEYFPNKEDETDSPIQVTEERIKRIIENISHKLIIRKF